MKIGDLVKMIDKDNSDVRSWGLNVGVIVGVQGDMFLIRWTTADKLWLLYPEELELIDLWEHEGCNPSQFIPPPEPKDDENR